MQIYAKNYSFFEFNFCSTRFKVAPLVVQAQIHMGAASDYLIDKQETQ